MACLTSGQSGDKSINSQSVNKSPGPDLIHPRVLFETSNVIARPLFLIFKRSLQTGIIPRDWKLAEVTAVHKKCTYSAP